MEKSPWLDKAMPIVSMAGIGHYYHYNYCGWKRQPTGNWSNFSSRCYHPQRVRLFSWLLGLQNFEIARKRLPNHCVGGRHAKRRFSFWNCPWKWAKWQPLAWLPAVFGPWMNISGSSLATWWGERPPTDYKEEPVVVEHES